MGLWEKFNEGSLLNNGNIFSASPLSQERDRLLAFGSGSISSVRTAWNVNAEFITSGDKKDEGFTFEMMYLVLEQAQQRFYESLNAATQSLSQFGDILNIAKSDLDIQMEALDRITIELSDGTKVYFDEDTGLFQQQDGDRSWHKLDEARQEEAQRLWKEAGLAGVKQDKMRLDQRQANIDTQSEFIGNKKSELKDIEQKVKNGNISHRDAGKVTANIEEEINSRKQNFARDNSRLSINVSPVSYKEEIRYRNTNAHQFEENTEKQISGSDSAFSNTDIPSSQTRSVSAFGSHIYSKKDGAQAFKAAATDSSQIESDTPVIDKTPTVAVTAFDQ